MDDLISKKALIKELQELSTLERISDRTGDMMFWVDKKAVYKIIENLPTIQSQGINKDRLIERLDERAKDYLDMWNDCKYEPFAAKVEFAEEIIDWVNQQPTSDGWILVSRR